MKTMNEMETFKLSLLQAVEQSYVQVYLGREA